MKKLFIFLLFISVALNAQTSNFRFAWLTDTHVGSKTGAEDLQRSVIDINGLSDIGFTIISGDITESGKTSDLRLAKEILDKLSKPYYIIPGNHDTKWSESGATAFASIWGSDRFVFKHKGILFLGLHEGPVLRMADGHFAPEDLRWFDKEIKKIGKKDQKVILVTHYPLDEQIDNWFEMTGRLKKVNTQAVLVGHGHANRRQNYEGITGIMGRSNLRAGKPVGGYNIVEVINDSVFFYERIPAGETKQAWTSFPLNNKGRFDKKDSGRLPDFQVNTKYPSVKVKWKFNSGYLVAAAPVVSGDVVVTGNSKGDITALNIENGKTVWKYNAGAAVYAPADTENDFIVASSADGKIICLNSKSGRRIWEMKTGSPIVAAPVIKKGIVYLGSSEGIFRAIDLQKGSLIWEYKGIKGYVETRPLVTGDKVIFGAWDNYLYALNRNDGSLAWKWSNGRDENLLSPAACWPVSAGGKVFVAAPDRYLTALDLNSGKPVWRTNKYLVRECIGMSEDKAAVYSKCMRDTVLAFKSDGNQLELLWAKSTGFGYDIAPSMLVEKEGVLFFSTKNGFVYALDGKSGETKWVHRTGYGLANTVLPVSSARVLVSNMDGTIMLLEKGKE